MTNEEDAVSIHSIRLHEVATCRHEEANTRIHVHARHAVKDSKVLIIKLSDTDRCPCHSSYWSACPLADESAAVVDCLWPKAESEVDSYMMCISIEQEKSRGLLFLHASLAAVLFQPSVLKGRRLLGKPGPV